MNAVLMELVPNRSRLKILKHKRIYLLPLGQSNLLRQVFLYDLYLVPRTVNQHTQYQRTI